MIASKSERRLTRRRTILIKDSIPARAAWIRSSLLPFVEEGAELFTSVQPRRFRRYSDVAVLGDPEAVNGAPLPQHALAPALRYTLTKQAWRIMSSTPHGAAVTLLNGDCGIASVFRNALKQLQRPDIRVTNTDDGIVNTGAWQACCRLRIRARETLRDISLEREIELPLIAPGFIFELTRRLDRLNSETHQAMRQYLSRATPVPADLEILLESAIEAKECLDTAASVCSQVVIQLDEHGAVVDISGRVDLCFERSADVCILGRPIEYLFPQLATMVASRSRVEQKVTINGNITAVRVAPVAQEPKRKLVILTPSRANPSTHCAVRNVRSTGATHCFADIIGRSPAIEKARQLALRAGQSDLPVLIVGDSGTGKELFAHSMHNVSPRASGPFIPINCAAIPESLIQTELFGYDGGAFTSARKEGRVSLFERAHGGTLFLDELGDMSIQVQAALLRVLEEGMVTRVGGSRAVAVDVRVIGAVNRPLEDLIGEGTFRRDLYHRLCVIPLRVPPLHERPQDIALLARHFLQALGETRALPDEVMDYFLRYRWPGNVRELQHCLKYMATITDDAFTVANLPPHIQPYVQINDFDREPNGSTLKTAASDAGVLEVEAKHNFPSLLDESSVAIFALIEAANHVGVGIGRRALEEKMRHEGFALSERAVRKRLHALQADGLIEWGLGRGGVCLTATGRSARRQAGRP